MHRISHPRRWLCARETPFHSPVQERDDDMALLRQFYQGMMAPWAAGYLRGAQRNEELLPSMDVSSDDNGYILHVELPGVDPDDVRLAVRNNILVISGEKRRENEDRDQHVAERVFGSFQRTVGLPEDADIDAITATHRHGVLCVMIPRKVATREKNIEISRA